MVTISSGKFLQFRKTGLIVSVLVALNICILSLHSSGTSNNVNNNFGKEQVDFEPSPTASKLIQSQIETKEKKQGIIMNSVNESNVKIQEGASIQDIKSNDEQTQILDKGVVEPKRVKKILVWNDYWKSKALWHKIFHDIIYNKCPKSSCVLTSEKSQLTSSDAILFHVLDLHKEKYRVPEFRDPKQIWIAMSFEPPYILTHAGVDFPRLNNVFNRTMTYRQDSDIIVRHGTFERIEDEDSSTFPNYMGSWVGSFDSIENRNYAQGKRRLVAWFASSRGCKSQSNRETYVKQLQQYIPVDIYGSCGPYKCGIQKTIRNPYKVEHDDCYMLVSVAYKFVLAFENSMCSDYVTEKLYNNLKLNVVAVVFGAANYSFYAPPNSVIDATQYTPKQLADYLTLLDENDDMYNEFFRWKKDFVVRANDGIPFICDLCDKLNEPQWETETKVYDHFDSWFEGKCLPAYSGNDTISYSATLNNTNVG